MNYKTINLKGFMKTVNKYRMAIMTKIQCHLNTILLKGNNVICEMCGWNGKYFPNNKCPKCNSYARTRLIPYSINFFNISNEKGSLLHIAPNISEFKFIKNNLKFEIYDRLDIVKKDIVNIVQDITNSNIPDSQYDLIIIWHVLEHIPNDYDAISEMYRILKENGKLLVSVPIYPIGNKKTFEDKTIDKSKYLEIHGHYDHCRSCGYDYFERFEKNGFKTSTLNIKDIDNEVIEKYGLSKNHTVWLFEK